MHQSFVTAAPIQWPEKEGVMLRGIDLFIDLFSHTEVILWHYMAGTTALAGGQGNMIHIMRKRLRAGKTQTGLLSYS